VNSYKKLCTEFYDIDKPEPPEDAFNFFLHYAQKANGPILEPMCGSGRYLIPLLKYGFDIEGADASPYMLQACRKQCKKNGLMPILYEQYLEQLELPHQYNLVFIPAGSFCLITEPSAIKEGLRRLHDLLLSPGKLVLEIERSPPSPAEAGSWRGRWVERSDGAKIIISWLSEYSEKERISRSIHRYDLCKDGQLLETEFEDFNLRFYDLAEFHDLLVAAGFREIKTFKAYQYRTPDDQDESVIFECLT
jgi:hypothetical protein